MGPFGSKTRQIGSWYEDEAWFVNPGNSWFWRGGYIISGTGAGIFTFGSSPGSFNNNVSFRIVLSFSSDKEL